MKHCNLSFGDWIIIENCYAYVLATHDIYYEAFNHEVQEDSSLQGEYLYTFVAYRIYCTMKGKRINRKSSYFTYRIEDYSVLTSDERIFMFIYKFNSLLIWGVKKYFLNISMSLIL